MAKRTRAGDLTAKVTLQQPALVPDGYGGQQDGWEDVFTYPARMMPLRGSETVLASRLQGTQPHVCTIRATPASRQVTPAWRAYDARRGLDGEGNPVRSYNITAVTETEDRAWIEVLVTAGEPS
jgi:head-tail adaptor